MNQYKIIDKLSSGSFGIVFKAVRLSDNRLMVLKRVPLANLDDDAKGRAMHEVTLMQQLHHPHIVSHRDAFLFNGEDLCIVMDYYGGGDLAQIVMRSSEQLDDETDRDEDREAPVASPSPPVGRKQTAGVPPTSQRRSNAHIETGKRTARRSVSVERAQGPVAPVMERRDPFLSENQVMLWFVEMALAVHYLHSHRIIHRDLKTQNMFVNSASGEVSIGDFGVARIAETHLPSATTSGTPLYMAPEVLQGSPATFKSDVWSLGCILYELLTLRHPFAATDISGLIIKIAKGDFVPVPSFYSRSVAKLIERMLDRDPRRRPLINEVLQIPFVRSYITTYLSVRVPLESYDSPSEFVLRQQLEALGVTVDITTEETDEVLTGTVSLAVAGNTLMGQSESDEPCGLGAIGAVEGSATVMNYHRLSSCDSPPPAHQLPLEALNSPSSRYERIHRTTIAESLPQSPTPQPMPHRRAFHQRADTYDGGGESPTSPVLQPVRRSTSHDPKGSFGAKRTAASMLPPPHTHISSSSKTGVVGDDMMMPSNVEDMRGKTIGELEREVQRYRQLVQQDLASLSQPCSHPSSHASVDGMDVDHPSEWSHLAALTQGHQRRDLASKSPSVAFAPGMAATSSSTPRAASSIQGASHGPAPVRLGGPLSVNRSRSNNPMPHAHPLTGEAQLRPNELVRMQRRKALHLQCVEGLGEKCFHDVYSYFNAVPQHDRNPDVVRRIVPDRLMWPLLPLVEEVLAVDRDIMRGV
ncbi:MAG: Serine/threonine-protein kinase PknD [Holosporales bacterium]